MKTSYKSGFTLIELLVVISIIGMLMGLLLPAVNSAREAGRRVTCQNNQKNIGLAILNYDSAKKELPPMRRNINISEYTTADAADFGNDSEMNWLVLILPYLEETARYDRIREGRIAPGVGDTNSKIPVLKCPSSTTVYDPDQTSYVANCGPQNIDGTDIWAASNLYYERADRDTTLFFDHKGGTGSTNTRRTTSIDFVSSADGTSKTLLLTENEDAGRWFHFDNGPFQSGYEYEIGFTLPRDIEVDTAGAVTGADFTSTRPASFTAGNLYWINFAKGEATLTDNGHVARYYYARPSANHTGIVIGAACDGSVQTISDSIDPRIYAFLCMPNDKQSVSFP